MRNQAYSMSKNMFEATLNAKPFDSEEECIDAVLKGRVKPGDAIFIRYEGPKGSRYAGNVLYW